MNKIKKIMSEVMMLSPDEAESITPETGMDNFEKWDSMTHIGFITALEEEFNIRMKADEVIEIQTLAELKEVLARYDITEEQC